ncbi:pyruvate decarboxylase [Parastagonospora nodorum]|nr:pyruvate decarboxylase [Parastagonospora nodorum]KAH5082732.1 pyruvate decarboxylase [Parastagonospora nodorum]KAH5532128.1 pyruvate decarboxylase [Parastagonospora nodorum]KAH5768865.1 pyruvate decarboxylase [Parastagonospora nodorum]KAH6214504.1 pyruvate decarboxylase [Parastagonospora nodorum]
MFSSEAKTQGIYWLNVDDSELKMCRSKQQNKSNAMPQIKIGDYLFKRLHELGIRSVFGVPGDYELALLDLVEDNELSWKGNPNELVASYAADGYARVNGAAAFITTFGPGELSAYCGMAGQYAEFVPVVHVVGYPTVNAVRSKAIMHHSLGNGEFSMYQEMAKHITAATTVIDHVPSAASEIDRVLNTMMRESRPVYIGLSVDMAYETISGTPLDMPIVRSLPLNDPVLEANVISQIRSGLENAKNPILILDGGAVRHGVLPEVHELIMQANIPAFTTAMGKGGLDEAIPQFAGVHQGAGTHSGVKEELEQADYVLWVGNYPSDFNTGEFTTCVNKNATIVDFQRFSVAIGEVKYPVTMTSTLQALVDSLKQDTLSISAAKITWDPIPRFGDRESSDDLVQDYLWHALSSFFRPGDIIIGETGTSAFGLCDSRLPSGVMMFNQTVFGSIGYATGAIVGVAQAIKESGAKWKRPVLVTGEGSMHLTIQAIGDMLRFDLKPIIFVLNNGGYTVERLIHGKTAAYNDVAVLDYAMLAKAFGPAYPSKYYGPIRTCGDLAHLLQSPDFGNAGCFELVELVLRPLDAPMAVIETGAAIDAFNKAKGRKSTLGA